MASIKVVDKSGNPVGNFDLKADVFGTEINTAALRRAILAEEANSRQGTHQTKERGDVRGGGRKPYKQKKTGNARQGTIRAPHYKKGGIVFGPHPRDYSVKVNNKERRIAIQSAINAKVADGAVMIVDGLSFTEIRTKSAVELLTNLGVQPRRVLVILDDYNLNAIKSFRNVPYVELRYAPNFSARDLITAHTIVVSKGAMEKLEEVWSQ